MKSWALTLVLLSVCGKLIKNLLPRGEKSPLQAPLRLLLSLSLIAVILWPLRQWVNGEVKLEEVLSFPEAKQNQTDADTYILEQMGKTMKKSVDTAFPNVGYTLEIYTNDDHIPTEIRIWCDDGEKAEQIALFIQKNYGIDTNKK